MRFIGIDVGLNGGIVILDEKERIILKSVMPIKKTNKKVEYDIKSLISLLNIYNFAKVYLEQTHVRPVSGKRACFMNGFGYGIIKGILESLNIDYEIVSPQKWMKEFGIISKDKKGSIEFCKKKWSKEDWIATKRCRKPHDGLTDAAVIALYGCRRHKEDE